MKKTKIKQVTNHKIFKKKMKILSQKNIRIAKIFIMVDP